jgi:hypothetical protein
MGRIFLTKFLRTKGRETYRLNYFLSQRYVSQYGHYTDKQPHIPPVLISAIIRNELKQYKVCDMQTKSV